MICRIRNKYLIVNLILYLINNISQDLPWLSTIFKYNLFYFRTQYIDFWRYSIQIFYENVASGLPVPVSFALMVTRVTSHVLVFFTYCFVGSLTITVIINGKWILWIMTLLKRQCHLNDDYTKVLLRRESLILYGFGKIYISLNHGGMAMTVANVIIKHILAPSSLSQCVLSMEFISFY